RGDGVCDSVHAAADCDSGSVGEHAARSSGATFRHTEVWRAPSYGGVSIDAPASRVDRAPVAVGAPSAYVERNRNVIAGGRGTPAPARPFGGRCCSFRVGGGNGFDVGESDDVRGDEF